MAGPNDTKGLGASQSAEAEGMATMKSLRVIRSKPNPLGKDRYRSFTPPTQLNGEWVDILNDGDVAYPMGNIGLHDIAFKPGCKDPEWREYFTFQGSLAVGKVVRIHAGHQPAVLPPIDANGADVHLYTGKNYVLNNDCGDTIALWDRVARYWEDKASYDPWPPEGAILKRQGDKLVP
jgi:hypothetical protein